MGHLERRITHQDIDAAEFSSGSINHRATVSRIGQVTTHEYASAPSVLNQPGDLSSVVILIEIGDQHVCAFACIRDHLAKYYAKMDDTPPWEDDN